MLRRSQSDHNRPQPGTQSEESPCTSRSGRRRCITSLARPHHRIPTAPIDSPAAWRGEDLRRKPQLVPRLFAPFWFDTKGEGGIPAFPIEPCRYAGGELRTFWQSDYFRTVPALPHVPALTAGERELLGTYDAIADDPAFHLDMDLEPGDIQLISNHTILHARTGFEEESEVAPKAPAGAPRTSRVKLSVPSPRGPASAMPSFDIVSEVDKHELTNAVDQAQRELGNRFDFRGTDAAFELDDFVISLSAPSDFQLKQMLDILRPRLAARGIDLRCLDIAEPEINLSRAKQKVTVKQGIEQAVGKKIIARIKDSRIKVEAQIHGDKLKVSGKKRDDLQTAIALLRKAEFDVPLQFENFRD